MFAARRIARVVPSGAQKIFFFSGCFHASDAIDRNPRYRPLKFRPHDIPVLLRMLLLGQRGVKNPISNRAEFRRPHHSDGTAELEGPCNCRLRGARPDRIALPQPVRRLVIAHSRTRNLRSRAPSPRVLKSMNFAQRKVPHRS